MINNLEPMDMPEWLQSLNKTSVKKGVLPITKILRDSLYYPASGKDGRPIEHLGGNVFSFVYVDYDLTRKEVCDNLKETGFTGYDIFAIRGVSKKALAPHGWSRIYPGPEGGDWHRHRDGEIPFFAYPRHKDGNRYRCSEKQFFALWIIMQRKPGLDDKHGPERFSLLHICAEGVETFENLYLVNNITPKFLAIIQPGTGYGNNWTDFRDPDLILGRCVLNNPAGRPDYLVYGGDGGPDDYEFYQTPCWPQYNNLVEFLLLEDKVMGIWEQGGI